MTDKKFDDWFEKVYRPTAMEVLEKWQSECDQFFSFPEWFPAGCRDVYTELLWYLLADLRVRLKPNYQVSLVRKAVDEHKQWLTEVESGRDLVRDLELEQTSKKKSSIFEPLERTLIGVLARYEYAAGLPTEAGLVFVASKDALRGYKSATGHQNRDDYKDKPLFQALFEQNAEKIRSLRDLDKIPELKAYKSKYKDGTLRDWISEIAPGHLNRGAPRKPKQPKRAVKHPK